MRTRYLFIGLLATTALSISAAKATVLLTMGQTSTGDTITASRSGSTTTISADTTVEVDDIAAAIATPFTAILMLNATNTGAASSVAGGVLQAYSGTFSITNAADTINYLSGTFTDSFFGSGGSATLSISNETAGESVSFTSSVIAAKLIDGFDRSIAFSFTDVSPAIAIASGTVRGFSSDVSGDFSSTAVPEPSTWAMMALGFAGLGFLGFRSTRRRVSAVA